MWHRGKFFKWFGKLIQCCCHFNGKFTFNLTQQPQREKETERERDIKSESSFVSQAAALAGLPRHTLPALSSVRASIIIADVN